MLQLEAEGVECFDERVNVGEAARDLGDLELAAVWFRTKRAQNSAGTGQGGWVTVGRVGGRTRV